MPLASDRSRTNLEPHPTRFIGRVADLSALEQLFATERLVTVLGTPGVGKTRFARRYAEYHLNDFLEGGGGGVWACDLVEATDALGICAAVGHALAIPLASPGSTELAIAHIGAAIAERGPVLIVLDGFERVAREAAATLGVWRKAALEARWLVTSRARLSIPGEVLFDLGPLELPVNGSVAASDAVQLFVDRARAVRRGYELDARDAEFVATLVRQLDGNPLAIELAAARMRVLSPAQLVDNLPRRFQLLDGAPPGGGARERTLWGAIEASWELLDPGEQRALAQCAVFRGGFALDAAEHVVALGDDFDAPWILDVLQRLHDHSLLVVSEAPDVADQTRFALPGSIRDYANAKLREMRGEVDARARHAEHYVRVAKDCLAEFDESPRAETMRRIRLEAENLFAVHRWALEAPEARARETLEVALALAALFSSEGPIPSALTALEPALERTTPEAAGPALYARGLEARGFARRLAGRVAESLDDCERARRIAIEIGEDRLLARVLDSLGWIELMRGRPDHARSLAEEALAIRRRSGDRRREAQSLSNIGDTFYWMADAIPFYEKALPILRSERHRRNEAEISIKLAVAELQVERYRAARTHLREALRAAHDAGERRLEALALGCAAVIEHEQGQFEDAEARFEQSLSLHRALGYRWLEGVILGRYGCLLLEMGRTDEALATFERALAIHREVGWPQYEGLVLACLAVVAIARDGDVGRARERLAEARARLEPLGRPEFVAALEVHGAHVELALARAAARAGDRAGAEAFVAAANQRVDASAALAPRSADIRFAVRVFRETRDHGGVDAPAPSADAAPPNMPSVVPPPNALVVCASGRWFTPPGGARVSLQRRRALHNILRRLCDERLEAPGRALSVGDLVASGWPDERMHPEAGADRVYTALSTLRKLGLRDIIQSRGDGYLVDPSLAVVRVAERVGK